jgi:hypothetical protein
MHLVETLTPIGYMKGERDIGHVAPRESLWPSWTF